MIRKIICWFEGHDPSGFLEDTKFIHEFNKSRGIKQIKTSSNYHSYSCSRCSEKVHVKKEKVHDHLYNDIPYVPKGESPLNLNEFFSAVFVAIVVLAILLVY